MDAVLLEELADRVSRGQVVWASSLTRLLQLLGRPDDGRYVLSEPWAILTAFQSGDTLANNRARNRDVKAQLERSGVSCYVLVGHWLEAPEDLTYEEARHGNKLIRIREEALFCRPGQSDVPIAEVARRATRASQQLASIVSDGQVVWIQAVDGHVWPVGADINVQDLESAYRKMRGQRAHPFEFV